MQSIETVTYNTSECRCLKCPDCKKETYAWRSSGMSGCAPHFYCSDCSNVILRSSDQKLIMTQETDESLLRQIESTLPICGCGGKFGAGNNPKCPSCGHEFKHSQDAVRRLSDPFMIITNGSTLYGDQGPDYRVVIKE